ncbi:17415_t:CDS:2 [Entrophospora sp. SA101]|nr:17415_t:CDS:2 [Entrophospora sp. SA101]
MVYIVPEKRGQLDEATEHISLAHQDIENLREELAIEQGHAQ